MTIDAHQHFWISAEADQPWRGAEHGDLVRDFTPSDLRTVTRELDIDGTVLIESEDGPQENDRLVHWSAEDPVVGVVGWLPLRDPDAARAERKRLQLPKLVGSRCLIGREPLTWLRRADVRELFVELAEAGLGWDVVPVDRGQCEEVVVLAEAVPGLRVVVDHLARPPLDGAASDVWEQNVALLASAPGIAIKFSVGLDVLTRWRWQPDQLAEVGRVVLDAFGPARVMIATNWPVCELAADYRTVWSDQVALLERLLPDETHRARVLDGTAREWYRLGESA